METQPPSSQDELRGALEDAFEHIDWPALRPIVVELAAKSDRFRAALGDPATVRKLTLSDLEPVLDDMFVVRRHREEFFQPANRDRLPSAVAHLLHGEGGPDRRIVDFLSRLDGTTQGLGIELATELLHFTAPDRYWLWTRWLYDAEAHTGILPVLLEGVHELDRSSIAERYLAVGRAISLVGEVEDTRWIFNGGLSADPRHRSFVADVFLAAAWGSYLYGVTAWRLTREFHKVLPPLPRLVRRLFGVARSAASHAGAAHKSIDPSGGDGEINLSTAEEDLAIPHADGRVPRPHREVNRSAAPQGAPVPQADPSNPAGM